MRKSFFASMILAVSLITECSFANHPNEGSLSLDELLQEAVRENKEILEVNNRAGAGKNEAAAARGKFFPQLSIEGGPLAAKFDAEKNSGTSVYGKAEWNIYNGGRDGAALEKSKLESDLAEKQITLTTAKVRREISRIFYEMLFLVESIALKEKALEMNEEQMKLAKLKKASGFTSNGDVIEFELREATLRSDLKKLLREKENRSRELSVWLGRPEPVQTLEVKGHLAKENANFDRSKILASLSENSPDVLEARLNLELSNQNKAISQAGYKPQIDIEGRYGKLASEERVFNDNDNYSISLKVKIPLFSGLTTTNEVAAARARVVLSESLVARTLLSTRAAVENLLSQMDLLQERLELEEKTLPRSEEYYKLTLAEYKRGVKNSPDMVGAAERLLEARIRNLEYRKEYFLTKIELLGLAGI